MTQFSKAGFWIRLAAAAVDAMVIVYSYIILFTLFFWFGYSHISSNQFIVISILLFLPVTTISFLLYYSLTGYKNRQSLGKKLFHLHIVNTNNQHIRFGKSLIRAVLFLVSILIFGFGHFYSLFSREKITLYDKLSNSFVKRDKTAKINLKDVFTVFSCLVLFLVLANIYMGKHIRTFKVESDNMVPTFLPGDRLLIDVYWPVSNTPNTGDLLLVEDKKTNERSIFRCVAIEEQTIEVRGDTIIVDEHVEIRIGSVLDAIHFGPETVPQGECFVLNDSWASDTNDSRTFGFVPFQSIRAKVGVKYFSIDPPRPQIHLIH